LKFVFRERIIKAGCRRTCLPCGKQIREKSCAAGMRNCDDRTTTDLEFGQDIRAAFNFTSKGCRIPAQAEPEVRNSSKSLQWNKHLMVLIRACGRLDVQLDIV